MTDTNPTAPDSAVEEIATGQAPPVAVLALEPEDLDGYSIDDLADYLDSGMTPRDPVIDISPSCQIALAALRRLKKVTATFLEDEAASEPTDELWFTSILDKISFDSRAGRQIPFRTTSVRTELTISEGAVRGLIRAAGDNVHGILVGRSVLDGDVTVLGEPIVVNVEANIIWRHNIPDAAEQLRTAIQQSLTSNTDLLVAGVSITISDLQVTRTIPEEPR